MRHAKRCEYCGKVLPKPKPNGRRQKYCTPAHKGAAYRQRIRTLLAGIRA